MSTTVKKRGRKSKKTKNTKIKKIYSSDINLEKENKKIFLLHLPINVFELLKKESNNILLNPPKDNEKFDLVKNIEDNKKDENNIDIENIKDRIINIMSEYSSSLKIKQWPTRTDIVCHWDFHNFSTVPIGIPKKFYNDRFYCYRNFCSFECAAAFLNHNKLKNNNYKEEYSLLNLMYKKLFNKKSLHNISCALSRDSLKCYGGVYIIDTFRKLSKKDDLYHNIIYPPLIPIVPIIEERVINENKQTIDTKFIPLNKRIYNNTLVNTKKKNKTNLNKSLLSNYFI